MADLPILFSSPMVRAILREIEHPGTGKTQTRRVLTSDCDEPPALVHGGQIIAYDDGERAYQWQNTKAVGDRLYVRETLQAASNDQGKRWLSYATDGKDVWPLAEWTKARNSIPSIHMPRWASRITLIVTDVRVQRLQEISEADALAEGTHVQRLAEWAAQGVYVGEGDKPILMAADDPAVTYMANADADCSWGTAREAFIDLWDGINASRGHGWDANPWVAAYTFQPILGNIDQVQP